MTPSDPASSQPAPHAAPLTLSAAETAAASVPAAGTAAATGSPAPGDRASPVDSGRLRTRLHQRRIELQGYRRDDGLWDVEGHLRDVKDYDFGPAEQPTHAGSPIHDMWLRITVDANLTIRDAQAVMLSRPYPGSCEQITPDYSKLIGLRIAPGFSNAVRELLGGRAGCAHLTEMVSSLATTAFQTLAGERNLQTQDVKPAHLDRCHALDTRGTVVREHYPFWYRGA